MVGDGPCGNAGSLLGGAGLRVALSPTAMVRSEILVDHSTSPSFNNVQLSLGMSLMPGSSRLTDSDHDLIYDRFDHCERTPAGAIVDKHGCPSDFDKDGVLDGLDRCPNTPTGALVNEVGCPRTATGTACSTAWINARAHRSVRSSTPTAAPGTATQTGYSTASTIVRIRRRGQP